MLNVKMLQIMTKCDKSVTKPSLPPHTLNHLQNIASPVFSFSSFPNEHDFVLNMGYYYDMMIFFFSFLSFFFLS